MSELHTFFDKKKRFQFTVKKDFLEKCPNPETIADPELFTEYKINLYLHNEKGPAVTRMKDGFVLYWIEGKMLTKEEGERIAHIHDYTTRFNDMIKE